MRELPAAAFCRREAARILSRKGVNEMKLKTFFISLLWGLLIILFPVVSAVIAAVLGLDSIQTLFLQGGFMLLGLLPPCIMLISGRWSAKELSLAKPQREGCRSVLYFLPFLLLLVPASVRGFDVKSAEYLLGNLFMYTAVGVAEELYFRGIVPRFLSKAFSQKAVVVLSTLIFGIGHVATAFAASSALEVALTVVNALLFGLVTIALSRIVKSIIPGMALHFLFNFETKITVIAGNELLYAELVRGTVLFALGVWLCVLLKRQSAADTQCCAQQSGADA